MITFYVIFLVLLDCYTGLLLSNVEQGSDSQIQSEIRAMNATIQSIVAQMHVLENKISAPAVAFLAELSHHINNPVVGSAVVFDVIHLNDGSAYSNIHGIFTAPVSGVYHFSLELSSPNSSSTHQLHVNLMHANIQLGYVYLDANPNRWLKRSTTATVHLKTGDDIWAKVSYIDGPGMIAGCCYHSIFSGFLIKAD